MFDTDMQAILQKRQAIAAQQAAASQAHAPGLAQDATPAWAPMAQAGAPTAQADFNYGAPQGTPQPQVGMPPLTPQQLQQLAAMLQQGTPT